MCVFKICVYGSIYKICDSEIHFFEIHVSEIPSDISKIEIYVPEIRVSKINMFELTKLRGPYSQNFFLFNLRISEIS